MSVHFLRRAGSLWARFAFCENPVLGRLMVFFRSRGVVSVDIVSRRVRNNNTSRTTIHSPKWLLFLECGDQSPLWSAATCRSVFILNTLCRRRRQPAAGKAVTGHRTPNKNSNQIRSGCDGSSFFKPLLAS